MKYALYISTFDNYADASQVVKFGVLAEESGWDAALVPDHIMHRGRVPVLDPIVILGGIAGQTNKIRIGTWITAVPRRPPWLLAKEIATLESLSKRRTILGVGSGGPVDDFEPFGLLYKNLGEKLDESLEIMKLCWKGEYFEYEGKHFKLSNVRLLPKANPEIWIGGFWPNSKPFERGVKYGAYTPVTPNWPEQFSDNELRQLLSKYRERTDGLIALAGDLPGTTNSFFEICHDFKVDWLIYSVRERQFNTMKNAEQFIANGPPSN
ncbi:MAG: LLM class flavin-dependent oxidoreductase [Candidatus Heimdallarchaeota archaeon]|nr:LLM class flavin-dependent oxidoreductase [Candidatus Heimdallarchaeota archaeon]